MKILHIVPSFGFGGMEKIICALINGTLQYFQHEILVIYNDCAAEKWLTTGCIHIHCLDRSNSQIHFIKSLYKNIKKLQPDVLMTYNWGATDAIWIGRALGIKNIIHNEHGFGVDEAFSLSSKRNIVRNILYRMTREIIVVSRNLERMIIDKLMINKDIVKFIPNGINTDTFRIHNNERKFFRKHFGYSEDNFLIGFSGRFDPVKNFEFMLEVFHECINTDANCRMMLIGDGEEKDKIVRLCAEKHMEKYVTLVGRQENVIPYLGMLDAFLLTSVTEQMPMTVLEAMALARPVVASNVGEIPLIIRHGQDGMIFDLAEQPTAFARALLELRDPAKRHAMGAAARQKILAEFQEAAMVETYRQVIERSALG